VADNPDDPLFIGLMSGTSMDGIDAALVQLGDRRLSLVATRAAAYPGELRSTLIAASQDPGTLSVDAIGRLDRQVGECFRDAALDLLEEANVEASAVTAIGSHGQTLRHQPDGRFPFTLQVGDPNVIAHGTGITTVADFRRRDLAAGGQGAPLAPAFHRWLFSGDGRSRVILNLGGIANLTRLPAGGGPVTGFDTGPANGLMDAWIRDCQGMPYDDGGAWASSGEVDRSLLDRLLDDPYFREPPPKSTGFEHFNLSWVRDRLTPGVEPVDVQATLLALTVATVADAVERYAEDATEILVCGGGASNEALLLALAERLPWRQLSSTAELGLDPDWVEAAAFAWLASRTLKGQPGNLPEVTGAGAPVILGGIYPAGS